ncbi:divalent metal cation transporter [Alicyclobacillus fastidiosus]|uniref:Divalent metal cation transporter n=1 Tax=Alicyclobacillus fastidiosus TaxID=392011 RepID=A0ABY6ZKF1_9BACL|nr:divalent metal cation transporter [Alicyclobacillus fastidiosus]WAH42666.1 divalent metal cation transporter [Alicyclobacillus fastidiosus]GMA64546.1 putative membrane transport protein [Alicyclobacillus fastidiosus]
MEMEREVTAFNEKTSRFRQSVSARKRGWRRYVWVFWVLLGPGLLAALADNDAGGVISYTATGVQFGIGLFVPLVLCLAFLTFTVQEMSMRLSAVTQEGFSRLARRRYGKFWGYYHISTLAFENLLTLITEFIGMTAGLILLGIPMWLSDLICLMLITSFVIFTGYFTKERIALLVGVLNVVFLVVAGMTHPSLSAIGHAFAAWNVPHELQGGVIWFIIATVGNAIAPWMIFFQGSGTIDKGVSSRELRLGRIDTAFGCIVQVIIAAGIIICGAALFGHIQNVSSLGPSEIINALSHSVGRWAAILFGVGLFDAGFLASITVSLSSSWSISELFGWSKSLNDKVREAPKFYAVYIGSLILAALAILIPNLPLNMISIITQVVGGILMAPLLIFLVLMTSDKKLMGEYRTKLFGRIWGWVMVSLLVGLTVATFWQTLSSL